MTRLKTWKVVPFAACLSIMSACGAAEDGTTTGEVGAPVPGNAAGIGSKPMTGSAGTAGIKAVSAGSPSAGSSAGGAGAAGTSATVSAVAAISPLVAAGASTGAAGAAGSSSAAGTGGQPTQPSKAGAGGTSTAGSGSAAGAGGKGGAGGTGSGAGLAAVSGTATFTKISSAEVDVTIDVAGCEDGKSYPVHIHEGTSCESAATQGAHWGAPATPAAGAAGASAAAGAAASAAGAGGSAGHDASHAGSGGSTAGAGGAAASTTAFLYRGEGIPDIKCTGTIGTTVAKRNAFDKRVIWTIGTKDESDVVGHVVVVHDGAARIACGKIEMK